MRLQVGVDEQAFIIAVAALASRHRDFDMPPLRIDRLGQFVALRPTVDLLPSHPLRQLADDCVASLDAWRAPASDSEISRHLLQGTSDPQLEARVRRWGYPHVFAHWRFHLTLSDSLASESDIATLTCQAHRHFGAALRESLTCGGLCVFIETQAGGDFRLLRRLPLAGTGNVL